MDGIKNVVVVEDDMGDGMLCVNHPYRNNPGGICAFCLQEKLGKLVSSSFPLPIRASSPSYRSETTAVASSGASVGGGIVVGSTSSMSVVRPVSNDGHHEECYTRNKATTRIPFLLAKKKKIMVASSSDYHHHHHHHGRGRGGGGGGGGGGIAFKRSKSASAPIRGRFLDVDNGGEFSPRKKSSFWSFLYLSSKTHSSKKIDKVSASVAPPPVTTTVAGGGGGGASSSSSSSGSIAQKPKPKEKSLVIIEDDDSLNNNEATLSAASSFERKVSRSRSVGCGSRSFSGDFFERISTGFGDCTLRRVESQREGKPKSNSASASGSNVAASAMKERVRCGGIFGGFIITSSSSSSSSSSYWLSSSSADQDHHNVNGRSNKSWGWAFASPMRAFTKPSSGKKDAMTTTTVIRESNNKNTTSTTTPNLSAIPSLLTVRI